MSKFLKAAASYFGLADTNAHRSEAHTTEAGTMVVTFEIPLTDEDIAGIAARMAAMREAQPEQPSGWGPAELPSREELRARYNALTAGQRSVYGSFSRYVAEHGVADPYEVTDTPRPIPPSAEVIEQWKTVKRREVDGVPVEITGADELRADYVARTTAAHQRLKGSDTTEHLLATPANAAHLDKSTGQARRSGSDGKPTSNADDFGGLPG